MITFAEGNPPGLRRATVRSTFSLISSILVSISEPVLHAFVVFQIFDLRSMNWNDRGQTLQDSLAGAFEIRVLFSLAP